MYSGSDYSPFSDHSYANMKAVPSEKPKAAIDSAALITVSGFRKKEVLKKIRPTKVPFLNDINKGKITKRNIYKTSDQPTVSGVKYLDIKTRRRVQNNKSAQAYRDRQRNKMKELEGRSKKLESIVLKLQDEKKKLKAFINTETKKNEEYASMLSTPSKECQSLTVMVCMPVIKICPEKRVSQGLGCSGENLFNRPKKQKTARRLICADPNPHTVSGVKQLSKIERTRMRNRVNCQAKRDKEKIKIENLEKK